MNDEFTKDDNIMSPLLNGSIFEEDFDSTKSFSHSIFENMLNTIYPNPILNNEEDYENYLIDYREQIIDLPKKNIEIPNPKILFNVEVQNVSRVSFGRKRSRPLSEYPKIHSKFDPDNMGRKIQVNYMDYLLNFINFCIRLPIFGINKDL